MQKEKVKRLTALFLCALLLLSLFGCHSSDEKDNDFSTTGQGSSDISEDYEFVIDAMGTKLRIPDDRNITIASSYAVVVPFIVALGLSDNVLAINYKSVFWADNSEGLAAAGSIGRGVIDLEALASYSPDVLIHRTNDMQTINAVRELGIPVLSIRAENIDEIMSTLDLMGRYFHVEERAEDVKRWMLDKSNMITGLAENIPEEKRLTALMMGGELGIVAGGDMLQSWMIDHAGATCLASEIDGGNIDGYLPSAWANIGMERLFSMDPDVIFATSSTVLDYSVEDLLNDPALSGLKAVINKRVFQMPARWDSWDLPGISCIIGTMWMLHKMYPEILSAAKLQAEIDEYYTFMFGRTFDKDYLGYDLAEAPVVVEGAELKDFVITVHGVEIKSEDLSDYPVYSIETTSTNMYGTTTTRVYIGYKVSDVLDAAGATDNFTTLVTIADDGYSIKVSRDVAMEPTTLIAVSEDGKLFREGPWFAPCCSDVTPDYLRELSTIRLEN